MVRAVFLFPSSLTDAEVDDLVSKHLAPAARASNAVMLTTSVGPLMGAGGPSPYRRVVEVTHDSIDDMMRSAKTAGAEFNATLKRVGVQLVAFDLSEL